MRLIQYLNDANKRCVGVIDEKDGESVLNINGVESNYQLAQQAIKEKLSLKEYVETLNLSAEKNTMTALLSNQKVLTPLTHPDYFKMQVTGTGLTHTGSAASRNAMHEKSKNTKETEKTDSMKMFELGLNGGKPEKGQVGSQPEWFYKGNGSIVKNPEEDFQVPSFSKDASEEPEVVGLYVNDDEGNPYRVGYAIANELSDHIIEKENYLYLAHSKLRQCSFGPELFVGDLPNDLTGSSRIIRDDKVIWEKAFKSGEDNMCHSIANLEYHHFKYDLFCQPNEVHVHFFGTATLSFGEVTTQDGDIFEIHVPEFGKALRNRIKNSSSDSIKHVRQL